MDCILVLDRPYLLGATTKNHTAIFQVDESNRLLLRPEISHPAIREENIKLILPMAAIIKRLCVINIL